MNRSVGYCVARYENFVVNREASIFVSYVIKEFAHAFSYAYIELWMHLGSLESSQEARVVSFFSVSLQQQIARDSHRLVSTYSMTSRNMLLSCRCHFEINRNPP